MQAFSTLFAQPNAEMKEVPPFLAKAMKTLQDENDKRLEKAGGELLKMVRNLRKQKVEQLRTVRKTEQELKKNLADFELSAQYFEHTGNFGPLSEHLGIQLVRHTCNELDVCTPTEEEKKIPAGWTPPTATS